MLRNPVIVTLVVTICLVLYHVLSLLGLGRIFTTIIFLLSPLLMLWLVLTILKDKKYPIKELKDGEEWGYGDRDKDSLGMF